MAPMRHGTRRPFRSGWRSRQGLTDAACGEERGAGGDGRPVFVCSVRRMSRGTRRLEHAARARHERINSAPLPLWRHAEQGTPGGETNMGTTEAAPGACRGGAATRSEMAAVSRAASGPLPYTDPLYRFLIRAFHSSNLLHKASLSGCPVPFVGAIDTLYPLPIKLIIRLLLVQNLPSST